MWSTANEVRWLRARTAEGVSACARHVAVYAGVRVSAVREEPVFGSSQSERVLGDSTAARSVTAAP